MSNDPDAWLATYDGNDRGILERRANYEQQRAREAREVQRRQAGFDQQAWDRYVDSRIERYFEARRAQTSSDVLPDALHEALGQVLAEERRQWRRERALIEAEAQKTISEAQKTIDELRATIAELSNEIRQKVADINPGVPGVAGPPGPPGSPGKLPLARKFESGRVFYEGDVAIRDGSTYQALRDTGCDVSHADWICLARAGRDGTDGLTPEVRGTYDAHESYAKLDIVACDGAAFIAKRDNPGICPGDGWQMMSRQGRTGRPGSPGERGPRGEKGETGPTAVVPQFIGAKVGENYTLIRVMSDGSKEIMPLRAAFERYRQETGD